MHDHQRHCSHFDSGADELVLNTGLLARYQLHAASCDASMRAYARLSGATFPFSDMLTACGAVWSQDKQEWLFDNESSFHDFSEALKETAEDQAIDLAEESSTFVSDPGVRTPLTRFLEQGPNALENRELLELLLSFDHYLSDPQAMSEKLFEEFGSLGAVLGCEPERLTRIEEMTPRGNGLLKAVQLAIERVLHEQIQQNPVIGSWRALLDYLRARLRHRQREELIVLYMDRQNRLIKTDSVQGTVNRVPLYPRDVAARALELFATAVIVAHNHPGGDAKASKDDVLITRQVQIALQALSIELYDHVIVCDGSYVSFKAEGLI